MASNEAPPAAGRFTEIISSDESRASAEQSVPPHIVPPHVGQSVSRKNSTRKAQQSTLPPAPDSESEKADDEEQHTWLAALYPLSHFIGFRPRSHPHAAPELRLDRHSRHFNRWHYRAGVVLSFGLPVSGSTGEVARYRDEAGNVHLTAMYQDQVGAKIINSLHSLIAAWVLVALLALVSRAPFFRAHEAPLLIGAFATEAVVTFFSYRVALAQPKNILFGNAISAIVGVALTKAFTHTNYAVGGIDGNNWAAAATIVSVAVFAMQMLGCIHPPGAAIALLANINPSENRMGWYIVPVTIISSLIIIGWALIINNLGGRRWPENWFYLNAFRDPPIIGPEKLPYSNSPYELPRRRPKSSEKPSFYRQSGAKTTPAPIKREADAAMIKPSQDAATRASEATRVGSVEAAPVATLPPAATEGVSRNNSKGSKRSIIIHVNRDSKRRDSDIPPVPAIQWRE